jgi:hypothetical protein
MALENGMGMSPADMRAIVGDGDGFGNGNGAWWIIILFILCGWGRGYGYGAGTGEGGQLGNNYALITDNATLERKIDGVYSGICDSTFALNNAINNGFAGVQSTLCQGFSGINNGMTVQGYETRNAINNAQTIEMQNANALQKQIADCCCQSRYDALQQNCATNTRDIIEANNLNTRAILDELQRQSLAAKDEKIAEQNQRLFAYELASSQAMQTNELISTLRPAPIPAFAVPNPYAYNGCGCNSGCGC